MDVLGAVQGRGVTPWLASMEGVSGACIGHGGMAGIGWMFLVEHLPRELHVHHWSIGMSHLAGLAVLGWWSEEMRADLIGLENGAAAGSWNVVGEWLECFHSRWSGMLRCPIVHRYAVPEAGIIASHS